MNVYFFKLDQSIYAKYLKVIKFFLNFDINAFYIYCT